jgi:hypothetical protein
MRWRFPSELTVYLQYFQGVTTVVGEVLSPDRTEPEIDERRVQLKKRLDGVVPADATKEDWGCALFPTPSISRLRVARPSRSRSTTRANLDGADAATSELGQMVKKFHPSPVKHELFRRPPG